MELQRNFTLMRDLDSRVQELMRNIDKSSDDYMSNIKGYSLEKKVETSSSIQRQFDKAKEYGDDKVQLAIQTYELVSFIWILFTLLFLDIFIKNIHVG